MMLGPCSAPSSPPEMPAPMKRRPRSPRAASRLRVSSKNELPPSIRTSPGSRCGSSSPITASTGAPALTMTMMRRGRSMAAANSPTGPVARNGPSSPYRSMNSCVRAWVRLCTATDTPRCARLRARFCPITASPVRPNSLPIIPPAQIGRPEHGTAAPFPGILDAICGKGGPSVHELPGVEEVRPGLWSVPVPIPTGPLRCVLSYVFEVPGGVVLVDPGWNAPEAIAALEAGLGRIGASVGDVRGVLVTHIHPDHYGLASLRDASLFLRAAVHAARPDVLLEDGDRPEVPGWRLVALHTPGHTPGHLCFHEERR